MSSKEIKLLAIYTFGVVISSGGLIFGFAISLFNNFFTIYMQKVFPSISLSDSQTIKSNANTFFTIGSIVCTFTSGRLFQYFGRRSMTFSLAFLNGSSIMLLCIPYIPLFYFLRFVSGIFLFYFFDL